MLAVTLNCPDQYKDGKFLQMEIPIFFLFQDLHKQIMYLACHIVKIFRVS